MTTQEMLKEDLKLKDISYLLSLKDVMVEGVMDVDSKKV